MEHFVGIDVAKDRLELHSRSEDEAFAVARNGNGWAMLVERLRALAPVLVALEATGGYETVLASAVGAAQRRHWIGDLSSLNAARRWPRHSAGQPRRGRSLSPAQLPDQVSPYPE